MREIQESVTSRSIGVGSLTERLAWRDQRRGFTTAERAGGPAAQHDTKIQGYSSEPRRTKYAMHGGLLVRVLKGSPVVVSVGL